MRWSFVPRRAVSAASIFLGLGLAVVSAPTAVAASAAPAAKTTVTSTATRARLLGTHALSLQWISWEHFGSARVTDRDGQLHISGAQRLGGDSMTIDGDITAVAATSFTFSGAISTTVSSNTGGKPCVRNGTYRFVVTGNRQYWRMRPIENPCEDIADYVDVYFRRV